MQGVRTANSRGLSPGRDIPDIDAALAELDRLADERTARWELVLLLGHPETISAARAWHRLIWKLELFAGGELTDPDEYAALRADIDAGRERFYRAARHDLCISSGEIPPGGPWEFASDPARQREAERAAGDADLLRRG